MTQVCEEREAVTTTLMETHRWKSIDGNQRPIETP